MSSSRSQLALQVLLRADTVRRLLGETFSRDQCVDVVKNAPNEVLSRNGYIRLRSQLSAGAGELGLEDARCSLLCCYKARLFLPLTNAHPSLFVIDQGA